jgi:hypothetical protein
VYAIGELCRDKQSVEKMQTCFDGKEQVMRFMEKMTGADLARRQPRGA